MDVNMTPLIDVSLVLVVILLVATPLAFQSSLAVRKANATGRKAVEVARTGRVELRVRADGAIEVNGAVVPRAALGGLLRPLLEDSPTRRVVIRCDDEVSHGTFVSVLDEARACGAVTLAVEDR